MVESRNLPQTPAELWDRAEQYQKLAKDEPSPAYAAMFRDLAHRYAVWAVRKEDREDEAQPPRR
jgi:hypothetical protein